MTANPDQVDLAKNLVALAKVLTEVFVPKMRLFAAGLITEWSTAEKADDLADVLEEAARQIRLCRPESNKQEETCAISGHPASTWRSAPCVTDLVSGLTVSTVPPVEDLDRSGSGNDDACPQCGGSDIIKWIQPEPDGAGGYTMRAMGHFCPRGCGREWKHPQAERDRVIDGKPSGPPMRVEGHAKAANQLPPSS